MDIAALVALGVVALVSVWPLLVFAPSVVTMPFLGATSAAAYWLFAV